MKRTSLLLAAVVCLLAGCDAEPVLPPPATPIDAMSVHPGPGGCVAVVSVARGSEAHVRCTAPEASVTESPDDPAIASPALEAPVAPLEAALTSATLATSSTFGGWPASNATDGNLGTSWFSASNDSAAKGKAPFFEERFAEPRAIHRVDVMGNRDPSWPRGFTILVGRLEVFDAHDRVLVRIKQRGAGDKSDFRFDLDTLEGVQRVRFTSLEDEGDQNGWGDIAIGEFVIR